MKLKTGQVVVTEGDRSLLSRLIKYATDSVYTHAFVVCEDDQLAEAWFPKVRAASVEDRIAKLRAEGRAYVVLDYPKLTEVQRQIIADKANSYIGRSYAVWSVVKYFFTHRFDRSKEAPFCSRLATAAYLEAGVNIYDDASLRKHFPHGYVRMPDLRAGYPSPKELFSSRLETVHYHSGRADAYDAV